MFFKFIKVFGQYNLAILKTKNNLKVTKSAKKTNKESYVLLLE